MRNYSLSLLFSLIATFAFSQIRDDFNDGNFNSNPSWKGDTNSFIVNSNDELQLNTSGEDISYLWLPSNHLDNTEWQFYIRMSFSPSNKNFTKIFLATDQSDLSSVNNGYFIRIGENLSDDGVDLFKVISGTETKLIDGRAGWASDNPQLRVRVLRDGNGKWELYVDTMGGTNFILDKSTTDNSFTNVKYFGILCTYTSSNAQKFFFDDFYVGPELIDTISPLIEYIRVLDNRNIRIGFNEALDLSSVVNNAFSISPGSISISNTSLSPDLKVVDLTTDKAFDSQTEYTLNINAIKDLAGNVAQLSGKFTYIRVDYQDVVINEIMADPSPPQSLPESEYLELYNQLPFDIPLNDWTISDASSTASLPDILFEKNSYLIICDHDDTTSFKAYGTVAGIDLPSLNNSGDQIVLRNQEGIVIDSVNYSTSWYQDDIKVNGGFSLEKIDLDNDCLGYRNWIASTHFKGGTPGNINSVYNEIIDLVAPEVTGIFALDNQAIEIGFNEKMDESSVLNPSNYTVDPGNIAPDKITSDNDDYDRILLSFPVAFESNTIYYLEIQNVKDCPGNLIENGQALQFGIPSTIDSGDLVINEILFNPHPGGYDFVELLNISDKILNLNDLLIARYDEEMNLDQIKEITEEGHLIFPQDHIVLTENAQSIAANYFVKNPELLIEIKDLPGYNDDEGYVVLLDNDLNILDQFYYSEDYHFSIIDDPEGVSLERINPLYATAIISNWHSAASSENYGTPTYRNSQYRDIDPGEDAFRIEPNVFSPDGDGYRDILTIQYQFERHHYFGSIDIYDISGKHIREIANNDLFGIEGFYSWDGINADGELSPTGVYIIIIEYSNSNGENRKIKKTATLHKK